MSHGCFVAICAGNLRDSDLRDAAERRAVHPWLRPGAVSVSGGPPRHDVERGQQHHVQSRVGVRRLCDQRRQAWTDLGNARRREVGLARKSRQHRFGGNHHEGQAQHDLVQRAQVLRAELRTRPREGGSSRTAAQNAQRLAGRVCVGGIRAAGGRCEEAGAAGDRSGRGTCADAHAAARQRDIAEARTRAGSCAGSLASALAVGPRARAAVAVAGALAGAVAGALAHGRTPTEAGSRTLSGTSDRRLIRGGTAAFERVRSAEATTLSRSLLLAGELRLGVDPHGLE